jgi:hypothetical protein
MRSRVSLRTLFCWIRSDLNSNRIEPIRQKINPMSDWIRCDKNRFGFESNRIISRRSFTSSQAFLWNHVISSLRVQQVYVLCSFYSFNINIYFRNYFNFWSNDLNIYSNKHTHLENSYSNTNISIKNSNTTNLLH